MLKLNNRAYAGAFIALLFGLFGWQNAVHAQLPTSVDIGLYETTPGMLEVRTVANGADFAEVVSSIVFTVRWETASGASLGAINQIIGGNLCPLLTTGTTANPAGVGTDGIYSYQNYTGVPTVQLQACATGPGYSWPDGTEVVLAQIPYSGATGCVNFSIVNDTYTAAQNYDFFISLNGIDKTGSISPSTVSVGCASDCIRISSVDPISNEIEITNYGAAMVDISAMRLCALFNYTANLSSVLTSGSTMLAPSASATFTWAINDNLSDVGLYLATGPFSDPAAMVDFVQYGGSTSASGRENVAVAKGIWSAGDFVDQVTPWSPPFTYTGTDCSENGVGFWTGADCAGTQGGAALPGTSCDDLDATTGNDVYDANCNCAGQLIDCEGVAGGAALPGASCDDLDATTGNDVYDANCNCAGQLIDCEGVAGGAALPGASCDDLDATTGNDVYDANCNCAGQLIDCEGLAGGAALPGTSCDDLDATTGNDVYDANCNCAGQLIDCEGVAGGAALPGASCDDLDATTGNDVYDANCNCAGQLIDCEGVIGGAALPGASCDDLDATTGNDVYDANCNCAGQLIDCEGVIGGAALPGASCDDLDPNTANDVYDANCNCGGAALDCEGVAGGTALPGTPCDDLDATTGNDVYQGDCTCAGDLIDCEGVAGGAALPGASCDDLDATTGNDVYDANCNCAGQLIDCEGVAGGAALPGTSCDDLDATTGNDVYDANCNCAGQLIDCEGVAGGAALPGTSCDDLDPNTANDVYDANCNCGGQALDCEGVAGGSALPGTSCDDLDATTGNDVYDANCNCAGQLIDCEGVAGGAALPGTSCDDLDPNTSSDVYDANCNCAGSLVDCEGVAGGSALPGTSCDDLDATTGNDVYDANCNCAGQLIDCEGVAGGAALPGTSCDDLDPNTSSDVYDANCNCAGSLVDCEGVAGGSALPGTSCDDLDATTGNDVYDANCNCAGQLIDCEGVAGGAALPGTSCDDLDPNTSSDVYDANCNCAGSLVDCEGVAGGSALPGTSCDDLDATTGNDVYDANCNCAGQLIDCEGVAGGSALPGTPCDDMDPATVGDVYDANCGCAGSTTCNGTDVTVEFDTDANGAETTWEIVIAGSSTQVCSGGPYMNNMNVTASCCLVDGCYELRVFDAMGDGMFTGANGGYSLYVTATGDQIIDNTNDGQFGSISAIANNLSWCVPIGSDQVKFQSCGKLDYDVNDFIQVDVNPAVSAEFGVGDQTDDGYQYWVFDPDGSFTRRIFLSHANPSIGAPPGATAVNHLNLQNLNSVQAVPQNVKLNVRVRSRVNGVYAEFGPACVIMVDPSAANDPCQMTKLIDAPGQQYFSCGVVREFNNGDLITAYAVPGATNYRFRFTDAANGFARNIVFNNYHCPLAWTTKPLVDGVTYDVMVQASLDGGATYCPFGDVCQVTIGGVAALAADSRILEESAATLSVYPNPNRGEVLNVVVDGIDENVEVASIQVMDMFGKQLVARTVEVIGQEVRYAIDMNDNFAQGMYLVTVNVNGKQITERVIKQ